MICTIRVTVNGRQYEKTVEPRRLLVDFLRDDLGLMGTHIGCEHGSCGACTVLLNGEAVRSCLLFAVQADGALVETVESLVQGSTLHPLQEAFWENHALQCGYCTPGILMSLIEQFRRDPHPTDEDVLNTLSGHLCRCTGYVQILQAVRDYVANSTPQGALPS